MKEDEKLGSGRLRWETVVGNDVGDGARGQVTEAMVGLHVSF